MVIRPYAQQIYQENYNVAATWEGTPCAFYFACDLPITFICATSPINTSTDVPPPIIPSMSQVRVRLLQ